MKKYNHIGEVIIDDGLSMAVREEAMRTYYATEGNEEQKMEQVYGVLEGEAKGVRLASTPNGEMSGNVIIPRQESQPVPPPLLTDEQADRLLDGE